MKRGKYVTTHLHLNVTYLMEADPVQEIRCKPDENSAVGWIPVEQIAEKSTEPWFVERVYGKLCEKVKRDSVKCNMQSAYELPFRISIRQMSC